MTETKRTLQCDIRSNDRIYGVVGYLLVSFFERPDEGLTGGWKELMNRGMEEEEEGRDGELTEKVLHK